MARTDLTVVTATSSAPVTDLFAGATAVDDVNGMQYTYSGGRRKLIVRNDSASALNVTEPVSATVDGLDVPNRTTTVAAGATAVIREAAAARQADGKIHVDFDVSASILAVVVED